MVTITIANNKGGVAKTSTVLGLADALAEAKRKILVIDMDPQCNTTSTSNGETEDQYTMFDILREECSLKDTIQKKVRYDLVPNDVLLSGRETEFIVHLPKLKLLKKQLAAVKDDYDYAIIDTPPNFGFYMTAALLASDGVVMPLDAEKYAVDGISQLLNFINDARSENENMRIYGALITKADFRYAETKNFIAQLPVLGEQNGFKVFKSIIRTCSDIQKAQNRVKSIYDYNRASKAVKDYEAFAKELERTIKNG